MNSSLRLLFLPALLLLLAGCFPDVVPPDVKMLAPTDGALVSGPVVLKAQAIDSVSVDVVQFRVDTAVVGTGLATGSDYEFTWDPAGLADRSVHTISASATDLAGNIGFSDTVRVTILTGRDIDIFHGNFTLNTGYYLPVEFSVLAADSLLGDARVLNNLNLTTFFWADSANYAKFQARQTYTPLDPQSNWNEFSLARTVPAAGKYYLVFLNTSGAQRTCWARFSLRRSGG